MKLMTCGNSSFIIPSRHDIRHEVTIVLDRGVKSIVAVHAVMLEKCVYNAFDVGEPLAFLGHNVGSWSCSLCHVELRAGSFCAFWHVHSLRCFRTIPYEMSELVDEVPKT